MQHRNLTIMGDLIPSASDWVLLLSGKITQEDDPFADVNSWNVVWNKKEDYVEIEVAYKSGREEVYAFSHECVAGGTLFVV